MASGNFVLSAHNCDKKKDPTSGTFSGSLVVLCGTRKDLFQKAWLDLEIRKVF